MKCVELTLFNDISWTSRFIDVFRCKRLDFHRCDAQSIRPSFIKLSINDKVLGTTAGGEQEIPAACKIS